MKIFICGLLLFSCLASNSQTISHQSGATSDFPAIKGAEHFSFTSGGDYNFFTKYFKDAVMNFRLNRYNAEGDKTFTGEIAVQPGVFGNTYGIDDIVPLGSKTYVTVENLNKTTGTNTLSAREFLPSGQISETEVKLMSMPFEKVMNSGFNQCIAAPDKKSIVVVSEMPFDKEQSARIKIARFDTQLKQTHSAEISLPGEDKKNKNISAIVSNEGIVYLLKKSFTANAEIALTVYQYDLSKGGELKEYEIALTAPDYIHSYVYELNSNGELMLAGLYYKRATLSSGETRISGLFSFHNKGLSEKVLSITAFPESIELLVSRKLLIHGANMYLCTEQFKEEREVPPAGTTGFDFNYNYTHKSDFVFTLTTEGKLISKTELPKMFTARNFDREYYSGYTILNGKLTALYYDNGNKYPVNNLYPDIQVPVIVQWNENAEASKPIPLNKDLKPEPGFTLLPSQILPIDEKRGMLLMRSGTSVKSLILSIN